MDDPRQHYPTQEGVDRWCTDILHHAEATELQARILEDAAYPFRLGVRHTGGHYVEMRCGESERFYCFWQPSPSGRGPILFHVPGYGAEMSAHPELVADGYNVLHVNPLGYATPQGPDESKRPEGSWPVLPDTVRSLGKQGYVRWLTQAATAVLRALDQDGVDEGRFAFFGSSQGGGTAMLLASIFRDRGVRAVAADVPFLVNFPMIHGMRDWGAYGMVHGVMDRIVEDQPDDLPAAWKALGQVDVTSHAHRLTMPVLLTAGAEDTSCPPPTIRSLFEELPATRSYTELAGQGHGYTTAFLHLARAWFRLYV